MPVACHHFYEQTIDTWATPPKSPDLVGSVKWKKQYFKGAELALILNFPTVVGHPHFES